MFREIILPIFRSTRLCVTACGIIHPHYTTSCNPQSSAPEDGKNNFPKHVELTGIINKPLLLHLVVCLYYLYQWCTVKQISDNEIYLLIKYIQSVLWRVAKRLSYIQDARYLKVNLSLRTPWRYVVQRSRSLLIPHVSTSKRWASYSVYPPMENVSGTHWKEFWVGPRTGLDALEKL